MLDMQWTQESVFAVCKEKIQQMIHDLEKDLNALSVEGDSIRTLSPNYVVEIEEWNVRNTKFSDKRLQYQAILKRIDQGGVTIYRVLEENKDKESFYLCCSSFPVSIISRDEPSFVLLSVDAPMTACLSGAKMGDVVSCNGVDRKILEIF